MISVSSIVAVLSLLVCMEARFLPLSQSNRIELTEDVLPTGMTVVAFGDITAERRVDVLLLSESKKLLKIYSKKPKIHTYSFLMDLTFSKEVDGVVVSDFDVDGNPDILVTFRESSDQFSHEIYFGDRKTLTQSNLKLPITRQHFTLLDYFGDLKPSLLATDSQGNNIVLYGFSRSTFSTTIINSSCEIVRDHSNAFIDLNGDCMADLILTCQSSVDLPDLGIKANEKYLEIWLNSKDGFNVFSSRKILPKGSGAISYTDFDGDGGVDIIVPVCDPPGSCSNENSIHLFFNKKKGVCYSDSSNDCLARSDICKSADSNFDFNFSSVDKESSDHLIIAIDVLFSGSDVKVLMKNPILNDSLIPIRFGDFNQDSYSDALISLHPFLESSSVASSSVRLLENVPCKVGICGAALTEARRRTFKAVPPNETPGLISVENAIEGAFIDINGDAKVDIVLNGWNPSKKMPTLSACQNFFYQDAFSLSALTVIPKSWSKSKPYGSSLPGVVYFYDVVDLGEGHRVRQGNQISQTAYNSLQLPHVLMGLGRVNNFLDQFIIAVPSRSLKPHYVKYLSKIIPNSDLVVFPPSTPNGDWSIELYINPADYILWVCVSLVSFMLFLAALAFIFKRRETLQDLAEKKKARHFINFDAL